MSLGGKSDVGLFGAGLVMYHVKHDQFDRKSDTALVASRLTTGGDLRAGTV